MLASLEALVPPRLRARARGSALEIHERLGGYIRGQIGVAAVMSVLQGLAFFLLGVPYAWLLGLISGVFNLIPYSPYVVGLVPALVVAGIEGGGGGRLLLIALVFTAVQKVEALYLTPVWVGKASKLHPLEVLLALIAFGHWFGVLGLLFAVPLMVCVKVALERVLEDYRQHPWFQEESGPRIEMP
jgi:predicted PurR-regulated permease PerM